MLFPSLPTQPMDFFETLCSRQGYQRIAGVDEVGRGPLAGPVIAAAVILPKAGINEKLFDSKKTTQKNRENSYRTILSEALGVGVGVIGQDEIDLLNIFQASLKAMVLAVGHLPVPPDFILIDGPHGLSLPIPQKPIIKGDQLSNSIAAASIVAKVTRDRLMLEYHERYPQYHFDRHKGYGTEEHRRAIKKYGICEIHRKTFRGVKEYLTPEPEVGSLKLKLKTKKIK